MYFLVNCRTMSDLFMNMQRRRATIAAHRVNSAASSTATAASRSSTQSAVANADEEDDEFANVLSLQLRKPKHWKWELTTSRSCTNIALPRIMLYDHTGELLVDANSHKEQIYRPLDAARPRNETRKRSSKAATANLAQSIRQVLDRQFSGLQIQEATPSATTSAASTVVTTPTADGATSVIDFYSNELPDYKFQRRANSLKGVRFKVDSEARDNTSTSIKGNINGSANDVFHIVDLPTPPSTTTTNTTATPTNSSSSGPREKRRYRRSRSSTSGRSPANSESILERFSFNKGRFSSPEFAEEHDVYHAPRYFLRTSKAGTLVVQEESFSRYRRRRRPRHSSSENVQHDSGSKSSLKMSDASQRHLKVPDVHEPQCGGSLQNVAELQRQTRKRVLPVRRYRSDGNMLLHKQLSTSEEEMEHEEAPQQRKYASYRRQSKKDMVTIDPDNRVMHAFGSPTAR